MDRPGYTSQPPPKYVGPTKEDMAAQRRQKDHELAKALPPRYAANAKGEVTHGSSFLSTPAQSMKKVRMISRLHRALSPRQWR